MLKKFAAKILLDFITWLVSAAQAIMLALWLGGTIAPPWYVTFSPTMAYLFFGVVYVLWPRRH